MAKINIRDYLLKTEILVKCKDGAFTSNFISNDYIFNKRSL